MKHLYRFSRHYWGCAAFGVALLLLTPVVTHAGPTPEENCAATQMKVVGKYAACNFNAESKLFKTGNMAKYTEALNKCYLKGEAGIAKAEAKALAAGASCLSSGTFDSRAEHETNQKAHDAAWQAVDTSVEKSKAVVQDVVVVSTPSDETVIDIISGLEWEKKRNLDGVGEASPADPHDADTCSYYTWNQGLGSTPDGTIFTEFLPDLNGYGASGPTCYAGHCDWRLPTAEELTTILDPDRPECDGSGSNPGDQATCIDPKYGPTAKNTYWTNSTDPSDPSSVFIIYFGEPDGPVSGGKSGSNVNCVRAVRTAD